MFLDAFMKFGDIKGASSDEAHPEEIEILSVEQGIWHPRLGTVREGKSTAERARFRIIKPLDRTSPELMQAAFSAEIFQEVVITLNQRTGTGETIKRVPYFIVKLCKVRVTGCHLYGHPAVHRYCAVADLNVGPLEVVDLTYETIGWEYKTADGKKNVPRNWNLKDKPA